jgi:hypothetical protein
MTEFSRLDRWLQRFNRTFLLSPAGLSDEFRRATDATQHLIAVLEKGGEWAVRNIANGKSPHHDDADNH